MEEACARGCAAGGRGGWVGVYGRERGGSVFLSRRAGKEKANAVVWRARHPATHPLPPTTHLHPPFQSPTPRQVESAKTTASDAVEKAKEMAGHASAQTQDKAAEMKHSAEAEAAAARQEARKQM